jgi:hypothetical protein
VIENSNEHDGSAHWFEESVAGVGSGVFSASRAILHSSPFSASVLKHSFSFEGSSGFIVSTAIGSSAPFQQSDKLFDPTLLMFVSPVFSSSVLACGSPAAGDSNGFHRSNLFVSSAVLGRTLIPEMSRDHFTTKCFKSSVSPLRTGPFVLSMSVASTGVFGTSIRPLSTFLFAPSTSPLMTAAVANSGAFAVTALDGSPAYKVTMACVPSLVFVETVAVHESVIVAATVQNAASLSVPVTLHFSESSVQMSSPLAPSSLWHATVNPAPSDCNASLEPADSQRLAETSVNPDSEVPVPTATVAPTNQAPETADLRLSDEFLVTDAAPSSAPFSDTRGFAASSIAAETSILIATGTQCRSREFQLSDGYSFSEADTATESFQLSLWFALSFMNATNTFSPSDPLSMSASLSGTVACQATASPADSSCANPTGAPMASDILDLSSAAESIPFRDSGGIGNSCAFESQHPGWTPAAAASSRASPSGPPDATGEFPLSGDFIPSKVTPRESSVPGGSWALRATPAFSDSGNAALTEALLESHLFRPSLPPKTVEFLPSNEREASQAVARSGAMADSGDRKESLAFADSEGAVETPGPFESRDFGDSRLFSTAELAVSSECEPSVLHGSPLPAVSGTVIASVAFLLSRSLSTAEFPVSPDFALSPSIPDSFSPVGSIVPIQSGAGGRSPLSPPSIAADVSRAFRQTAVFGTTSSFAPASLEPGGSAGLRRSFPGAFAESSVLVPTESLIPRPSSAEQRRAGTQAWVSSAWIAIVALLILSALAVGLILRRARGASTIPTDNIGFEDLTADYTATDAELSTLEDHAIEQELEFDNPLLSDGIESSGIDYLSDVQLDEAVVLL